MEEIRIQNWNDLLDTLYAHSWKEALGRFRSNYAFRGMTDASDPLTTTLTRLGGCYERQEGHLLRNFRKYARRGDVPGDSLWNWLSLAQHHGLPTRLLDWTFPLLSPCTSRLKTCITMMWMGSSGAWTISASMRCCPTG